MALDTSLTGSLPLPSIDRTLTKPMDLLGALTNGLGLRQAFAQVPIQKNSEQIQKKAQGDVLSGATPIAAANFLPNGQVDVSSNPLGQQQLAARQQIAEELNQERLAQANINAGAKTDSAQIGADARRYGADQGLAGKVYGADTGLEGKKYVADVQQPAKNETADAAKLNAQSKNVTIEPGIDANGNRVATPVQHVTGDGTGNVGPRTDIGFNPNAKIPEKERGTIEDYNDLIRQSKEALADSDNLKSGLSPEDNVAFTTGALSKTPLSQIAQNNLASPAARAYAAKVQMVASTISHQLYGARITDQERNAVLHMLPNPDTDTLASAHDKLQAVQQEFQNRLQNHLQMLPPGSMQNTVGARNGSIDTNTGLPIDKTVPAAAAPAPALGVPGLSQAPASTPQGPLAGARHNITWSDGTQGIGTFKGGDPNIETNWTRVPAAAPSAATTTGTTPTTSTVQPIGQ